MKNDFEQIIKIEKRKKLLKMIGVSIITTLILLFVFNIIVGKRMQSQYARMQAQFNILDDIQSPNIESQTQYLSTTKWTSSTLTSERVKNIDGYQIPVNSRTLDFGLIGQSGMLSDSISYNNLGNNGETQAYDRVTGQKLPLFFNPNYQDDETSVDFKITHEAESLNQLSNHVAEVAITFDQPYSYEQIQKMIPENLLINWYWLGTNTTKLSPVDSAGYYIGTNLDENHSEANSQYKEFKKSVNAANQLLGVTINDIDIYQDAEKQIKKYPTLEKAKFSGIIVSGRTENLANLDSHSFTYATSVGLQTEILPYIKPTK